MTSGAQRRRTGLAAVVTVLGVLIIWTLSTWRQQEQTEALSRDFVGQQWDVARDCLLGTPFGRDVSSSEREAQLLWRAVQTIRSITSANDDLEAEQRWPVRCVPMLSGLHVEASILNEDPGDAVVTLEVLAPRVFGSLDTIDAVEVLERARGLEEAIAILDRAMPPGAQYDESRFAPPQFPVDPHLLLRSLRCEQPTARALRPLFGATLSDGARVQELATDSRTLRLTEEPNGDVHVATSEGGEPRALSRPGGRAPAFFDERRVVWITSSGREAHLQPFGLSDDGSRAAERSIDLPVVARRVWACPYEGGAHLVLQTQQGPRWMRWSSSRDDSTLVTAVELQPRVTEGSVWAACTAEQLTIVWPGGDDMQGVRCAEGTCRPLPPLLGAWVDWSLRSEELLVLTRRSSEDLPSAFFFQAADDEVGHWGASHLLPLGRFVSSSERWRLQVCSEEILSSADGRQWRAETNR